MRNWVQFIFIGWALFFSLGGCFKKTSDSNEASHKVSDMALEVQIPKELMREVVKEIGEDTKTLTPVYVFVPLQIELHDKSPGVLSAESLKFDYPKGGGQLDLKKFVVGNGSFYFNLTVDQFSKLPDLVHLYYVSHAPIKKIEDEHYGLGCGKWVDIKSQFKNLQKEDFLKLNTNQLRYLYVVAGTYVFVFRDGHQIYLSQLTITDSRYTNELCLTPAGESL
ncbi:MAG: hypothetical protein H7061_06335 [Bdellovibrionaceae bacterium]|nr:hypothetical protein [Bdellovibrio sp.]